MAKLNISPSRRVSPNFSVTPLTGRLGPKPVDAAPISQIVASGQQEIEYNNWQVLDNFDEGLRQALIQWIDTTKEGVIVTNPSGSTRSKTINFQFYGNPSKDIIGAGDIGEFSLAFQYTKKIISPVSTGSSNLETR